MSTAAGIAASGGNTKAPAITIPGVEMFNHPIRFNRAAAEIHYEIRGSDRIKVWDGVTVDHSQVLITTFESASGVGKSTLASALYDFLFEKSPPGLFQYAPPKQRMHSSSVGMIPQKPNQTKHWVARDIVGSDNLFLSALFEPEFKILDKLGRTMDAFSGGQSARLLMASALHRLLTGTSIANYLLLDEAFEGVDASTVESALEKIARIWSAHTNARHLYLLIITHLNPDVILRNAGLVAGIQRITLEKKAVSFDSSNQRETTIVEVAPYVPA